MDIRSIIDSEDTPPTRKPSEPASAKQEYRPSPTGFPSTQAPAYDNRRDARPPQPSPLQTPSQNGTHFTTASPNDNLRSPYQRTSSFGLNTGQYPPAQAPNQSPHYAQQAPYYPQREGSSANGPPSGRSFGQSTPLSQTPTASTPGSTGAYSTFQRPTSSHSIPTPSPTQHSSSILRESPQPSNANSRPLSQPQGGQQYTSQPGTPLGPPSTYNRPSLNIHWESPRAYSHQRSHSGGIASQHETPSLSAATRESPSAYREPRSSIHGHSNSHERERSLSVSPKTRVPSPPGINRMDLINTLPDPSSRWSGHVTPAKRNIEPDPSDPGRLHEPNLKRTPSRPIALSGLLNAEPSSEASDRVYRPSQTRSPSNKEQDSDIEVLDQEPANQPSQNHSSSASGRVFQHSHDHSMGHSSKPFQVSTPTTSDSMTSAPPPPMFASTRPDQAMSNSPTRLPSQPEIISSFKQAALKTSNGLIHAPLPQGQKTSRGKKQAKRPIQEPSETEAPGTDDPLLSRPVKKKPRLEQPQQSAKPAATQEPLSQPKKIYVPKVSRYEDVPIFAQSVRGPQRTKYLFEANRKGVRQGPPTAVQAPYAPAAGTHRQANGTLVSSNQIPPINGMSVSNAQLIPTSDGLLGPWEYNIANVEPLDEVIRLISDFLFLNVVMDDKVGVAPAGGGRGLGAIFEIEAKIGRIIDNNTNDRIRLPVESECVISRSDPSIKTRFESSMTQQQHSTLNKFLNNAFLLSQGPKTSAVPLRKPRIPMTYKHTHETDTQYGLSQQGTMQLPPTLAQGKKPPKVRITTDDKTGEILAKIIKTPVADIHIYCPRTLFDWRISVNIEMDFNGDMKELVAMEKRDTKGDRKKDRVSYKHLQYQIDLTQVTSTEPENKARTHELEIEVSSEEVRRQGQLVGKQEPNEYEKLIKGFVDNVRLLARHCVQ